MVHDPEVNTVVDEVSVNLTVDLSQLRALITAYQHGHISREHMIWAYDSPNYFDVPMDDPEPVATEEAVKKAGPDKSKAPPLRMDFNHEWKAHVRISYQDLIDSMDEWIEVDVLGCWGRRYARDDYNFIMLDDDDCPMEEKVYGKFEILWVQDAPQANYFWGMVASV